MTKRIFLIGYMTSGKSFLGRTLAKEFNVDFVDLDNLIEIKAGKNIPQIFQSEGEEAFRLLEQEALQDIQFLETQNIIISTGGGTPCFEHNMKTINDLGISIFLDCPPEIIVERLTTSKNIRPIVEKVKSDELLEFVTTHLNQRRPFYNEALYTVLIKKEKKVNLQSVREILDPIFNPSIP